MGAARPEPEAPTVPDASWRGPVLLCWLSSPAMTSPTVSSSAAHVEPCSLCCEPVSDLLCELNDPRRAHMARTARATGLSHSHHVSSTLLVSPSAGLLLPLVLGLLLALVACLTPQLLTSAFVYLTPLASEAGAATSCGFSRSRLR